MKVAVIDGQGAGIGQSIIKKIRKELSSEIFVYALGTNTAATSAMIRSGANTGITGEAAICSFLKADEFEAIIGPIGIICSGGINGEITTSISQAIFETNCTKYIIPLRKHGIYIPGTRDLEIKEIISEIVFDIKSSLST